MKTINILGTEFPVHKLANGETVAITSKHGYTFSDGTSCQKEMDAAVVSNSNIKSREVEDFSNGDSPDLREADLSGLDLRGLYLRWADLRGADLQGADLRGADLQDANLQGADLRGANLQDANLRYADLQEADLRGADLQDANLQRTDLQDADLRDADLRGADLRDANLQYADLRGADLDYCGYELSCKTIGIIADSRLVSQLLYHLCQMDVQDCPEWDELRNDERVIALANKSHVIDYDLPEIEQT